MKSKMKNLLKIENSIQNNKNNGNNSLETV